MNPAIFRIGIGIVLSGLVCCPAFAQSLPSPPPPAATSQASPSEAHQKVRCKKMTVTGSRMTQTVCHTEEDWNAMQNGARTFMRDIEKTRVSPRSEDGGM